LLQSGVHGTLATPAWQNCCLLTVFSAICSRSALAHRPCQTMSARQPAARAVRDSAATLWSVPTMVDEPKGRAAAIRSRSKIATPRKAERLIATKRKELATLDDEFFGEVVGVAQAIDELRKALNQLSAALDARHFEKASSLGYGKVAEEFVFLQRTLGGLQGACLHKEKLVSDLAFALRCPYEDVLPKVDALLESARPLDRKQRIANRKKAAPQIRAAVEALSQKFGKDAGVGIDRTRRRGGRA